MPGAQEAKKQAACLRCGQPVDFDARVYYDGEDRRKHGETGGVEDSRLHGPAESYVVLTEESQSTPVHGLAEKVDYASDGSFADRMSSAERLHDIVYSRSDIERPICPDCTDTLLESLDERLLEARRERDRYAALKVSLDEGNPTEEEVQREREQAEEMEKDEQEKLAELKRLEGSKAELEDALAVVEEETEALAVEEEGLWQKRNMYTMGLLEETDELHSLRMKHELQSKTLQRLLRTNVYNDTFSIGHDGYFATINGLRLGRLPNQNVEWAEIDAAWGLTLLLLSTLATRFAFQFQGYVLKPLGSTSKIEKQEVNAQGETKTTLLDLFGSRAALTNSGFNKAIVAFLECLRQIGEFCESRDGGVQLPYRIAKDIIGNPEKGQPMISVRLVLTQDAVWTSACKYMLTK